MLLSILLLLANARSPPLDRLRRRQDWWNPIEGAAKEMANKIHNAVDNAINNAINDGKKIINDGKSIINDGGKIIHKIIDPTKYKPTSIRNTTAGLVQGLIDEDNGREKYLGIPFAAPPTGDNRFRAPQPTLTWGGVKQTTKSTGERRCISLFTAWVPGNPGSEDCLYLDVHVPKDSEGEKLPVWFWIYGGGFMTGGKESLSGLRIFNAYEPTTIMNSNRVVFVAVNYRVDVFGYMAHPAFESESPSGFSSGNYGLLDQTMALNWVKKNIANFNGDPDNVMVMGQSAGGSSVDFHIVSHVSKGLLKSAYVMSGPPDGALWQPKAVANEWAEQWTTALDCETGTDEEIRNCLRSQSPSNLMAQNVPQPSDLSLLYPLFGWMPNIDGFYLTNTPVGMVAAGNWNKVPTMFGVEKNEGSMFAAMTPILVKDSLLPVSWSTLKQLFRQVFPYNTTKQELAYDFYTNPSKAGYQVQPDGPFGLGRLTAQRSTANAIRDVVILCSTRRMLRAIASQNVTSAPTYFYFTNYEAPLMAMYAALGNFHGFDTLHLFDYDSAITQLWTDGDTKLGEFLRKNVYEWAMTSSPNEKAWQKYTTEAEMGIYLDGKGTPQNMLKNNAQCDFWDELGQGLWEPKYKNPSA